MKTVLDELKEIEAHVSALIQRMEAEHKAVTATVREVRRRAILEEVFRNSGKATRQEISDCAKKYGRDPGACSGYYSGKEPSMRSGEGEIRLLTESGSKIVRETREKWGEDWLDRVPLNVIGNHNTAGDAEVSF